jgi:2-phosphoglycerate kinase
MKYFIYGVPGVGKTSYSKVLAKKHNLVVIEGDNIKRQVGKEKLATCKAYKQFGELNQANVEKGLLLVRETLLAAVEDTIKQSDNFVLEAAFLDPVRLRKFGKIILLTTTDQNQHKKQFLHHPEKLLDVKNNEFRAARMLQKFMLKEAKRLKIEIINSNDIRK